jgi:hypothetical protein
MWLGKEVIVKAFWLSWGQETGGDEKFSGYHVVRERGDSKSFLVVMGSGNRW